MVRVIVHACVCLCSECGLLPQTVHKSKSLIELNQEFIVWKGIDTIYPIVIRESLMTSCLSHVTKPRCYTLSFSPDYEL